MAIGTALAIAAGTLGSAVIGSKASKSAAKTQADAADRAANQELQMFERQVELQEPFRQAGITGQNRMLELLGLGGNAAASDYGRFSKDFSMSDFEADPGYSFRLGEGMKALERQAAVRGGLLSGGAIKAGQRFAQDLGSQEYQNAFNRYQVNRSNQLQPLQSLSGSAQTAANTIGQAGQVASGRIGEAYQGAGNARASGYVGSANAMTNSIGQGINLWQQNRLLDQLKSQPSINMMGYM